MGIKRTMKTQTTTHANWLPILAINDNMLQRIGTTGGRNLWLHSVKFLHAEGHSHAQMQLQFFTSPMDGEYDFFGDFKAVGPNSPELRAIDSQIQEFMAESKVERAVGSFKETVYFMIPLIGMPFVQRAISVARMLSKALKEDRGLPESLWLKDLDTMKTSEVMVEKVWVTFARQQLLQAGVIAEKDLLA